MGKPEKVVDTDYVDVSYDANFKDGAAGTVSAVTLEGITVYVLHDPEGTHVATCADPRPLASMAFDSGAQSVKHAYDLREAMKC